MWKTTNSRSYSCHWAQTDSVSYFQLFVKTYSGSLEGDSRIIHQDVTNTKCNYNFPTCIPSENPLWRIIWEPVHHDFKLFHSLGKYPVKQIGNWVLVPLLGIGGSVLYKEGKSLLLETGYQIIKQTKSSSHNPPSFLNFSIKYVKKTHSNYQRDLAEGQITAQFLHEHEIATQLSTSLCRANKELAQLRRWLLLNFPETSASYLYPEPGYILEPMGEGLLLHACERISKYNIFWNGTYNGTCFSTFPVTSDQLSGIYFLELNKRRLSRHSRKIPCHEPRKPVFVTDKHGRIWKLKDNKFSPLSHQKFLLPEKDFPMTKIAGFNPRLIHYDKKLPSRLSLLNILDENKDNLERLQELKEEGNGDIAMGIGKILGKGS